MSVWGWISRIGGYDGAQETRNRPSAQSRGARLVDEDSQVTKWGRERLRLECFDLYRNNPIVRGVTDRFADNVVGTGIVPQAQTSSDAWNEEAEAYWREWCKVSDYRQRVPFRVMQRHVITGRMLAGETLFVLTKGGQLQPVEADRIVTPESMRSDKSIIEGVKIGPSGIISGYYIAPRGDGGVVDATRAAFVDAADVVHCAAPFRVDQLRGIPELSPIITALADLKQIGEKTLKKIKNDASRAAAIETDDGAAKMGKLGPRNAGGDQRDGGQVYEAMDDVLTYYLRRGEKVNNIAAVTPNTTLVPYIEHVLSLCGGALSLPPEMCMLDFRGSSFSSNKAAMAQTYRTFTNWHAWECEVFNQRVWNWRIAKAIKEGDLPQAPTELRRGVPVSQWYRVEWSQPDYTYLDPEGSIDTAIKAWNLGISGISSFTRLRGRASGDTLREKGRNIVEAAIIAEEINKRQPALNLNWRDLINAVVAGANQPAPQETLPAPAPEATP